MFPIIPSDLSSLSADDLNALLVECDAAFAAAPRDASTPDDVAALVAFGQAVETVRTAIAALDTTAEPAEVDPALAAQLAELDAAAEARAAAAAEAEATAAGTGGEPDEVEVLSAEQIAALVDTAVTAAIAERIPARTRPRPAAPATIAELNARMSADHAPLERAVGTPFTITASADVPGVPMGTQMDRRSLAEAMIARWDALGQSDGNTDKVPVGSFNLARGAERTLSPEDYGASNFRKIAAATEERQDTILAAGGLCAPVDPYYDQMVISQDWRPVAGAMPQFTADRGGLRFNPPPSLADLTGGYGTITAATDLAGGSGAQKTAFAVTCAAITEVDVEADFVSMEFGNFGARTFPENVEAWMALAAAAHARQAEGNRLTDIKTGAPAVTAAGLVGAGRELLTRLEQLRQGINSNARRPQDTPVDVILEQWAIGLIRADFTRTFGPEGLVSLSDDEISQMFADRHLAVTLTPDTAAGNNSIIAAPVSGVIKEYPTVVHGEVFIPGTYLMLDNGRLDLGLIRDSFLTMGSGSAPGNRFRMFYENFEALAVVGPAGSRAELAMSVCADGTYGAAKAVTCPIVT